MKSKRYRVPYLKAIRLLTGWTQKELADTVGKSAGYVANAESGRTDISAHDLIVFSQWLGVEPEDLL